jgi:hypothetical protein
MSRLLLGAFMLICAVPRAFAADVYVVQGFARGQTVLSGHGSETVIWATDGLFFNRSAVDVGVRLLGVSNGSLSSSAPNESVVSAQRSMMLSAKGLDTLWRPTNTDPLWVLHLDVPEAIVVNDVLFIKAQSQAVPNPELNPQVYKYGKIGLPIFNALVPPNQAQVSLGTSLGDVAEIPSHSNVAIYNGGFVTASARIDVRRHCDDQLVQSRTLSIAANTIVQVINLTSTGDCSSADSANPAGIVYTVVTVDQPSFSFVSSVANTITPFTSLSITASQ